MSSGFSTTSHGKWILAGEHSIVDGGKAIVFPFRSKQLSLDFQELDHDLTANFNGEDGADIHLLFWSVLEHGMQLLGQSINSLSGHFELSNNIPIGAGLGASAALCVSVARWFVYKNLIQEQEIFQFAKQLEHLFHGKSSGLDIAGCVANQAIIFESDEYSIITSTWTPKWYLSFCGQIGITSHCVKKVLGLTGSNPDLASSLYNQMNRSVNLALDALLTKDDIGLLAHSIELAAQCFGKWGLITDTMQNHMDDLRQAGAIATKPTGSGDGGFVLSLWEHEPNCHIELFPA